MLNLSPYLLAFATFFASTALTQAKTPAEDTPTSEQPGELTFNTISHLWQARLEAACDVLTDEISPSQQQCLNEALDSLTQALSHFQAPGAQPLETLQQIDTSLNTQITETADPDRAQAADYIRSLAQAVPFHPACLDQLGLVFFAENQLTIGFMVCEPSYPVPIEIRDYEGNPAMWSWRPAEYGEPGSEGSIFYQVKHQTTKDNQQTYYVDVQTETGGTGIFASIWVLHQADFLNVFEPQLDIIGGDRCNDGNLQVINVFDDGRISYSQNATPFRLFNLTDTFNQRQAFLLNRYTRDESDKIDLPESFMDWEAYTDVDNCAMCCAGELFKQVDPMTGESELFAIGIKNDLRIEMFYDKDTLVECSREWFAGLPLQETNLLEPEAEIMLFEPEAWLDRLDELSLACAGVPHD